MSNAVQWTVLTPLLLVIVLGIIQVGLWGHGQNVARNAAAAGAEEAALLHAPVGAGEGAAREIAERGGLVGVQVRIARTPTRVTAVVSGRVPSVVDLGQGAISEQVSRPVERVTTP